MNKLFTANCNNNNKFFSKNAIGFCFSVSPIQIFPAKNPVLWIRKSWFGNWIEIDVSKSRPRKIAQGPNPCNFILVLVRFLLNSDVPWQMLDDHGFTGSLLSNHKFGELINFQSERLFGRHFNATNFCDLWRFKRELDEKFRDRGISTVYFYIPSPISCAYPIIKEWI